MIATENVASRIVIAKSASKRIGLGHTAGIVFLAVIATPWQPISAVGPNEAAFDTNSVINA